MGGSLSDQFSQILAAVYMAENRMQNRDALKNLFVRNITNNCRWYILLADEFTPQERTALHYEEDPYWRQ